MNAATIRTNPNHRNDFLAILLRQNRAAIRDVALKSIHGKAFLEPDVIHNECAQAFLLRANRAINSYKEGDDGRGKNSIFGWCKYKGLLGVRDFIRQEFGNSTRQVAKNEFNSKVVYLEEFTQKVGSKQIEDPIDYSEKILSAIVIREFIESLEPLDRSLVSLLVFGTDSAGNSIRCGGRYGSPRHRISADLSRTTGYSESFLYKRLTALKEAIR